MSNAAALNRYLASVEQRAFRMARYAVSNGDEAMDIVQDAMLTLARKYAAKPEAEWPPLFFRILRNRIIDFHRRHAVRSSIFAVFTPRRERRRFESHRGDWRWPCQRAGVSNATRPRDPSPGRCGRGVTGSAARSIPVARLGRARCGGDRAGHEMLARKRQNALFAGGTRIA